MGLGWCLDKLKELLTVSLAPNTRRNHTAREMATLLECRRSSKSWPLAPWGTLFPSLWSGTAGLARSANQACRFASFRVTLVGILNVESLIAMEDWALLDIIVQGYARNLGNAIGSTHKYFVHYSLKSRHGFRYIHKLFVYHLIVTEVFHLDGIQGLKVIKVGLLTEIGSLYCTPSLTLELVRTSSSWRGRGGWKPE